MVLPPRLRSVSQWIDDTSFVIPIITVIFATVIICLFWFTTGAIHTSSLDRPIDAEASVSFNGTSIGVTYISAERSNVTISASIQELTNVGSMSLNRSQLDKPRLREPGDAYVFDHDAIEAGDHYKVVVIAHRGGEESYLVVRTAVISNDP